MKRIVIESEDIRYDEERCSDKQFMFIESLMHRTTDLENQFKQHLKHDKSKLSKRSASKLIDCLINRNEIIFTIKHE